MRKQIDSVKDAAYERGFGRTSAAGYDNGFGAISGQFIPRLLQAARVGPGQRVLDVATGTGAAAEAALDAIGPSGSLVATDVAPAMLEKARVRLGTRPNASFGIEDGQNLSFPDRDFDAVVCAMGLMLFPCPDRGLAEFRRVLRDGGWVAVSVNTVPERAFVTRVDAIIGRHAPERAATAARYFCLGNAQTLDNLFVAAGFRNVGVFTEARCYAFSCFSDYFQPIERGEGPTGQSYITLPPRTRQAVREDVRRQLELYDPPGAPIELEVELLFACGQR